MSGWSPLGWSLRTRATLLAVLAVGAVLTAAALVLLTTLESRLTTHEDDLARSRLADLLVLVEADAVPAELTPSGEEAVAQVLVDGRVVGATPNVAGQPPLADFAVADDPRVRVVRGPDDTETETYRLWGVAGTGAAEGSDVYVGAALESVSEASMTLRRALLVGVPATTLVLGVVIWWLLGRVLRRLDRVRERVDDITGSSLDRRVPGAGATDEVGRLARTMNAMLDRLEHSVRRQRELVADVSHDLQSPLAAQRAALEVALRDPAAPDLAGLRTDVLGATSRMERLVSDLLLVAASDAGAPPTRVCPVDLDDVVREEATRVRSGSAVAVHTSEVGAAPCWCDPDDARRIVRNLLDNAVTHARSEVHLRTDLDGPTAWLEVRDDGPGIPSADHDRLFDRFYRSDPARTGGGTGLGLAIARGLAERNDGTVELATTSAHGSCFVLRLPQTGPQRG